MGVMVIDEKETFGGIISEEEKDKARKIRRKYLGIYKTLDDSVDSLEEGKVRRPKENLKNDL